MRKIAIFLILLSCIILACNAVVATHIGKILEKPRDYDGKTVIVAGKVTETFTPLFIRYFVVDDGTGRIAVVTWKPLPQKGEKVRIKGKVNEVFALGDTQTIVIIEEPEDR
jgi:hypothetical protein